MTISASAIHERTGLRSVHKKVHLTLNSTSLLTLDRARGKMTLRIPTSSISHVASFDKHGRHHIQITTDDRTVYSFSFPTDSDATPFLEQLSTRSRVNFDSFELLKQLGHGTFGRVFLARLKMTGQLYAMKSMAKSQLIADGMLERTYLERSTMLHIHHPLVVRAYWAFQTASEVHLVMESLSGCTLLDYIKHGPAPILNARLYAAEIAMAIGYLHAQKILHRDVKPENVFLDMAGHCRLGDFGLVKLGMEQGATTVTFCGTPYYMSPEMVKGTEYGVGQDWWSLGCILYEMVVGRPPYCGSIERLNDVYRAIVSADEVKLPSVITKDRKLADFLRRILVKSEPERLGCRRGFAEIKEHAFFAKVDWDGLLARRVEMPFVPNPVVEGELELEPREVMDGQSMKEWTDFTMVAQPVMAKNEDGKRSRSKKTGSSTKKT